MSWSRVLLLSVLGLGVALLVALLQDTPGYMDADYYFAGGVRLAQGYGLNEPFLWNYLDDPAGLPRPSHTYWMPLASFLAALSMKLSGSTQFWASRVGFLLLIAALPVLTAWLCYSLTKKKNAATLAGLLAIFPAFFLPYLSTTDTFGLYMVLGALFLLAVGNRPDLEDWRWRILQPIGLGLLAGLMHLARADGVIWLGMAFVAVVLNNLTQAKRPGASAQMSRIPFPVARFIVSGLLVMAGYLLVMGPWFGRNFSLFGTLFAPGGGRALWITQYDELFAFPASFLTPQRWLSSGLPELFHARLWALGQNLQTVLAVQGEIFLFPLVILGFWQLRHDRRVQIGGLAWLVTFLVMTIIFPFQGARGGFFHSGAAIQPLWWALVPAGLASFIAWGERVRGWSNVQAQRVFGAGLLGLAILLTLLVTEGRVLGKDLSKPVWEQSAARYNYLEQTLQQFGAQAGEVVMVNNPPGYYVTTDRPGIVTPFGDEQTLLRAAHYYNARYVLLEFDHAAGLDGLYDAPGNWLGLKYLTTVDGTRVYKVEN
jgi:hypothetical protein